MDDRARCATRLARVRRAQRSALQRATFSLGANFIPNIEAASGSFAGASVRFLHSYGLDPRGFRTFTDLRLEGAGGDSSYGRAAIDVTLSRGLFRRHRGRAHALRRQHRRRRPDAASMVPRRNADDSRSERGHGAERQRVLDEPRRAGARRDGIRISLFGDVGWTAIARVARGGASAERRRRWVSLRSTD